MVEITITRAVLNSKEERNMEDKGVSFLKLRRLDVSCNYTLNGRMGLFSVEVRHTVATIIIRSATRIISIINVLCVSMVVEVSNGWAW